MGRGAKVALGCGCVFLLGGLTTLGLLGYAAWWARGRVADLASGFESLSRTAREIEHWERAADANPYSPPADGVIREDRLLRFLQTRKEVYAVYERYEEDLRDLERRSEVPTDKLTPSDILAAGGKLAEVYGALRLAQMKALAGVEMSEDEYRDIQVAVYKTAWASEVERRSGRLPAEAVADSVNDASKQVDETLRSGLESARRKSVPGAQALSPEDLSRLKEAMASLGRDAGRALSVPMANVQLFRKHEAEIKKYAMTGLAFLGL
jgi:hypothetical protein